jgi:hypothetical protein
MQGSANNQLTVNWEVNRAMNIVCWNGPRAPLLVGGSKSTFEERTKQRRLSSTTCVPGKEQKSSRGSLYCENAEPFRGPCHLFCHNVRSMIFRWAQFNGEINEHGVLKSAGRNESNPTALTKIINASVNDNVIGWAGAGLWDDTNHWRTTEYWRKFMHGVQPHYWCLLGRLT